MARTMAMGLACIMAVAAAAPTWAGMQELGADLPPPAAGSYSTLLATESGGGIYACDGDTLYKHDGSAFASVYTGIVSAAGGAGFDPSGLAVNANGTLAYVASGFTGRIVEIDIAADSAGELSGATLSNSNYGIAVDPIYGLAFVTSSWTSGSNYAQSLYLLDPSGNGSLTLLDDFGGSAWTGGGMAFSPNGELIVPVPTSFSVYPTDDEFTVDLYRFSRAWLNDLAGGTITTGAGQLYASDVVVSGSGAVAVDSQGNVYLMGADAIYAIEPDGDRVIVAGNPSDNAWDMADYGFLGLAYDADGDRLVTGYDTFSGEPYRLFAVDPVPEPATLGLLAAGGILASAARRRR